MQKETGITQIISISANDKKIISIQTLQSKEGCHVSLNFGEENVRGNEKIHLICFCKNISKEIKNCHKH